MTKPNANPFDNFPQDGTPLLFQERMELALAWLAPHLNENDINHQTLLANCKYYTRLMSDPALRPHDEVSLHSALREVSRRQHLIVNIFGSVRSAILASKAVAQAANHGKAQSERASKPRKFDEDQAKRAAKAYHEITSGRAEYGGVKALAAHYGVTTATIRSAAKRYPLDSIDQ